MRACWALSSVHLADARALTLLVLRDCPHLFDAAAGQPLLAPAPAGPPAGGPPGAAAPGGGAAAAAAHAALLHFLEFAARRAPGLAALTKLRALDLSANARLRRLPAGVAALCVLTSLALDGAALDDAAAGGAPPALAPALGCGALRRLSLRGVRGAGPRGSLALPPGVATALARLEVRGLGGGAVASGAACVGGPAGNVNTTAPLKPCGATPPQVVNLGGASRFDPPLPPCLLALPALRRLVLPAGVTAAAARARGGGELAAALDARLAAGLQLVEG